MSLLLTSQILRRVVNTLAADEKYPFLKRDNLTIPIHMQLSHQQKIFSEFSPAFLKSSLNFISFETKDHPRRFSISEITNSKNVVKQMSKKFRFRGSFDKQHGKRAESMLKSPSQHLCPLH